MAAKLGTPLMPWQRMVADVALELDPGTGRLAHREVGLTVPRQSGKTTLLLAMMVHRALGFGDRQRIVYTAQTRNDARQKWEDGHVAALDVSPFRGMYRVRKSNGSEAIKWRNGSLHGITATTEKSGHGETLDLGVIDEAFAQVDNRLEQAMKPAMITRPQPQLWVVSTAGTPDSSSYLWSKVEAGRKRAEAGGSSVAYFEWSADEDADPADPATWWSCMPALGHTIGEDAVRADFESMLLPEFRRAYLNQWVAGKAEAPIPLASWDACADPASEVADPVAFAFDVTPDRAWASIAVAGRRPDGRLHLEVVNHRPGTGWVVERLGELVAAWKPSAVVADLTGPAGSLAADAERVRLEVVAVTAGQHAQACGRLYDEVVTGQVRHRGQLMLAKALDEATKRPLGDGGWAWSRKSSAVDICPLVAVTLAGWAVDSAKVPASALGAVW